MSTPQPDLSNGATKYGARLGRGTLDATIRTSDDTIKVSLRRIRLDAEGYDEGGAYWGIGKPLYWAGSPDGSVDLWFRAGDRDAAKEIVLKQFPKAKFYR